MKIDNDLIPYLKGEKFSNGISMKISEKNEKVVNRLDYIVDLCKSKKVIHIGFADHLPLIDEKIGKGIWLHSRLVEAAERCVGIDINREAIDHVTGKHGITDIYEHNIETDQPLSVIREEKWDYMVMGEILEHVDNPVAFLSNLREKYKPYAEKLIITVPNAFELSNLRYLKNHKEAINSDHRFWFTPYTLSKIAVRAGWEVDHFLFCQSFMPQRWYLKFLINRYPAFRETLVIVLK